MSFSPGVSDGGPGPSAQLGLEDSALAAAPGAPQMPLLVMNVLSPGQRAPSPTFAIAGTPLPSLGMLVLGLCRPPCPCGVRVPSSASTSPLCRGHLPPPPLRTRVLCHSRNLACPSDRFVIRIVTARQGHVTNEHIQRAECLWSLIESVHNWELSWAGNAPCTDEDLPFRNSASAPGGRGRAAAAPRPVLGAAGAPGRCR